VNVLSTGCDGVSTRRFGRDAPQVNGSDLTQMIVGDERMFYGCSGTWRQM
jgi:hypothetical protein